MYFTHHEWQFHVRTSLAEGLIYTRKVDRKKQRGQVKKVLLGSFGEVCSPPLMDEILERGDNSSVPASTTSDPTTGYGERGASGQGH